MRMHDVPVSYQAAGTGTGTQTGHAMQLLLELKRVAPPAQMQATKVH